MHEVTANLAPLKVLAFEFPSTVAATGIQYEAAVDVKELTHNVHMCNQSLPWLQTREKYMNK